MKQDYNFVQYFTRNHTLVPDLSKAADLWNETEKINLFFLEAGDRKELEEILRKQGGVRLTSSMAGNMEINDGSAHKGAALKWVEGYRDEQASGREMAADACFTYNLCFILRTMRAKCIQTVAFFMSCYIIGTVKSGMYRT